MFLQSYIELIQELFQIKHLFLIKRERERNALTHFQKFPQVQLRLCLPCLLFLSLIPFKNTHIKLFFFFCSLHIPQLQRKQKLYLYNDEQSYGIILFLSKSKTNLKLVCQLRAKTMLSKCFFPFLDKFFNSQLRKVAINIYIYFYLIETFENG